MDAVLKEYIERKNLDDWLKGICDDMETDAEYALSRVDEIPVADVRPVVRGQWKTSLTESGKFWANYCGVCDAYVPYGMEWEPNFCPACGADMREANRRNRRPAND